MGSAPSPRPASASSASFEPLATLVGANATRETVRARANARTEPGVRANSAARLTLIVVDFAAVNLAFYLAWFARYRLGLVRDLDPGNYVEHEVYIPLQVALALVFVLMLGMRGLYRLPRAASALDDLSTIFTASGLALMVLFAGSTFVRYPAESRLTLIFAWVLMTALVVLGRALCLWGLGALHQRGIGVSRT